MAHVDFDPKAIAAALEAAKGHSANLQASEADHTTDLSSGTKLTVSGGCVSVTIENNQVCLNLPFGFGAVCLPIPISFPSGTAAQACLDICTTWGVPTGIRVTVSIAGRTIVSQTFGIC